MKRFILREYATALLYDDLLRDVLVYYNDKLKCQEAVQTKEAQLKSDFLMLVAPIIR